MRAGLAICAMCSVVRDGLANSRISVRVSHNLFLHSVPLLSSYPSSSSLVQRINGSLLCGPVDAYNISYAGSDSTDVYSIPAANCSSNCRHLFPIEARNSPQYNVSVAGFGVLGTIKTIGEVLWLRWATSG